MFSVKNFNVKETLPTVFKSKHNTSYLLAEASTSITPQEGIFSKLMAYDAQSPIQQCLWPLVLHPLLLLLLLLPTSCLSAYITACPVWSSTSTCTTNKTISAITPLICPLFHLITCTKNTREWVGGSYAYVHAGISNTTLSVWRTCISHTACPFLQYTIAFKMMGGCKKIITRVNERLELNP